MPEAPEVRIMVERYLKPYVGATMKHFRIVSGRYKKHGFPSLYHSLENHMPLRISKVGTKGKASWIELEGSKGVWYAIYITLGMTGHYKKEASKHTHYHFITNRGTIYLEDMRNFGTIRIFNKKEELQNKIDSLGLDFFSKKEATWKHFYEIWTVMNPKMLVCDALMDQERFAGIGNYIRAEVMYRSRINPFRPIGTLQREEVRRLYRAIMNIMKESYEEQKQYGLLENTFYVYMQQETNKGERVERTPWKGRSIWWVPSVQH